LTTATANEKKAAAEAAAALVEDGMLIGLGTGTTVAFLLPAIAARRLGGVRCVATSPATEAAARQLGLHVVDFTTVARIDLAIDGADQVSPERWLVKGGGGAHTREKVVAAAAERFVVIVSSDKLVDEIAAPVPLELLAFGLESTLAALGHAKPRAGTPPSPDGGIIADWFGRVGDPATLAAWLDSLPGLVSHGLFPPDMVSNVLIGRGSVVDRLP
jgi:ribose 5-phosphate isomerase A